MSVNNRCAPGGGRPNGVSFAPGSLEGTSVRAANPDPGAIPNQFVVDALDRATTLLPAGYFPQITPEGGRAGRSSTNNHPNGDAADIQIVSPDGNILTPAEAPELYETFIGGLVGDSIIDNRVAGIGLYNWGIHFDQSAWRQTGSGGVQEWNGWGSNPNPGPASVLRNGIAQGRERFANNQYTTDTVRADGTSGTTADSGPFLPGGDSAADVALDDAERAQTTQAVCSYPGGGAAGSGGSGGCSPVSALAIGGVASMVGGLGLAVPSGLTDAVNQFSEGPLAQITTGIAEQVGGIVAAADGLVSNVTAQLSATVGTDILGMGANSTFNAITGRLPAPVASILGGQNIISGAINNVANQVFANGDLARFSNVFSSALGAVGIAQGLGQSLGQIQNQIFGNARNIIGELGSNLFENISGMTIDTLAGGLATNLIGDQSTVLSNLLGSTVQTFAAFGSVYRDFNSMVTQGLGSVTGNINLLGRDLGTLGKLADMSDLLRIGTPGQIVEQLILNGATVGDYIVGRLANSNVSLLQINSPDNDDLALEILGEIQDPESIQDALNTLNIQRSADAASSLADLTDKNFLFPQSKDVNNFNNLNEISLHLAVCGAQGFQTLEQFGSLLSSMESVATEDSVRNFVTPVGIDEILSLRTALAPTSEYSGDNNLTVADFLGTAAGYRHTETLPKMRVLMDELNSNSITANYRALNTLLSETLNGNYTVGSDIIVPTTVGYTFGTYTSLDAAALAIKTAIETELDVIENTATGETLINLRRLQSYHDEISHQLYKEHKLRQQYGINITDNTEAIEFFAGDGSSVVFQLTGTVGTARPVAVFLDGVKQSSNKVSYNRSTNRITFNTAPGSGIEIEVNYDNGRQPITGSVSDIWNFAGNLENFGNQVGFGREADFLQRVVTNDSHGVRIKAAMIQSRNRQRAADAGMECPGYNRTLSSFYDENVNGLTNYADLTGIWSDDSARAAEIYLQNQQDVEDKEEYVSYKIKQNSFAHQRLFDRVMSKVLRQLIFYSQGNIAVSVLGADFYTSYNETYRTLSFDQTNQLKININAIPPANGYAIGSYKQIISEILRIEDIETIDFVEPLTPQTQEYLQAIGVDMKKAVGVLQKTMLTNASNYLGINENDVRNIFGMPGVGKYLLYNISNRL